jgi:hypothetical protein
MFEAKLTDEEIDEQLHLCAICCVPLRRDDDFDATALAMSKTLLCLNLTHDNSHNTDVVPIPTKCLGLRELSMWFRARGSDDVREHK